MANSKLPEHSRITTNNLGQYYWLGVALLGALMVVTLMRDLHRPICGMHSWAEAHSSWFGRVQLKYGMSYTKGLKTWAVGDPPKEDPTRYLDHPQLQTLLNAAGMHIFGWRDVYKALQNVDDPQEREMMRKELHHVNDAAMRKVGLVMGLGTLLFLMMILRPLLGDAIALSAGMFYIMFPLTGYFGVGAWVTPTCVLALWCYLVLIRGLPNGPVPKKRHLWGLALCLFLALQFSWSGFFWALGIGVHYLARCIFRRKKPQAILLTVLIAAPLLSLGLDFLIMWHGYDGEWQKIWELYTWRESKGERTEFLWSPWFAKLWEHSRNNWTIPSLVMLFVASAWGALAWTASQITVKRPDQGTSETKRGFPYFWLFLLPGVFQLFLLRGCLWEHQTWIRPFSILVAIGAALGVARLGDVIARLNRRAAAVTVAILVGIIAISCAAGLDDYHSKRHYSPTLVRMWQKLNAQIPPDKKLLAWHHYTITQHESKGTHYRPEVGWYLDREIATAPLLYRDRTGKVVSAPWPFKEPDWQFLPAETMRRIDDLAQTGRYPHYLVSQSSESLYRRDSYPYRRWLIGQLKDRYEWESIEPDPILGGDRRYGAHVIFNLAQRK